MKSGLKTVRLQPGRERSLKRFHPWVYSGAVDSCEAGVVDGDMVEVLDASGAFLACGFYSSSSIAIKAFSFKKVVPCIEYWSKQFLHARNQRAQFGLNPCSQETNAFRLINAEGDGIPGLIVDIYGSAAVIQCHSSATHRLITVWKEAIENVYQDSITTIFSKSADTLENGSDQLLKGKGEPVIACENSLCFHVDIINGQKTGFFIDQRENRQLVREIAANKRVLNLFCYTGGFSVAAACGGAAHVTSVDSSSTALELCQKNLTENGIKNEQTTIVENDCFKYLENETERFDLIIVDPPPFAKSRATSERALQGYRALNNLAFKRLEKHGEVLTFSCSQVVSAEAFTQAVAEAGIETGRQLRILRELQSPSCHPVGLYHPEGDYLKGLYLTG